MPTDCVARIATLETELRKSRQILADWRDADPLAVIETLTDGEGSVPGHWLVSRNLPADTRDAVASIDRVLAGA